MTKYKRWTLKDIDTLYADYGILDIEELAEKLQKDTEQIHWKAKQLNFKRGNSELIHLSRRVEGVEKKLDQIWNILVEIEKNVSNSKNPEKPVSEGYGAIGEKDQYLIDNYYTMPVSEICEKIDLTTSQVYKTVNKLVRHGLLKKRSRNI
jgi:predicted transcriptional regulator